MDTLAIQTENLIKQFDSHTAVNQVNLTVAPGEVYGLIGPNGAGKTTLLRMLSTAEEPTAGEIAIYGETLRRDSDNPQAKRRIGFLPDDFPLYNDLSVWDYLDYFARLYFLTEPKRTQRLNAVLELVQLTDKRNATISTLSRGMQQRLGLARTVVYEPSLLLLDEPVSGLDPIARIQFRDAIRALQAQGMTVVISSHILSDLDELCTSIGIMQQGQLVESSRLEDLYERLSSQQILIHALEGVEALKAELDVAPHVGEVELMPGQEQVRVKFAGSQEDAARLLQSLVYAGLSVTQFQPTQDDLESIFLKLDYRQTS